MNTIECNQRCSKCSHWKNKDEAKRLPTEIIIRGINSIKSSVELCIVGGEPLLFKSEIYEILSGISGTNIRTIIITNGVSMDKEFIHNVINFNIHIVVSIDTLDNKFWKFVRGIDSYSLVLKNLDYATSVLKPEQISIQSVLAKETLPYLSEVAEYASSKQIYHSIQGYIKEGFEGNWTEIKKEHDSNVEIGQQCFASERNLSIVQNGDVYTCFQQNWIKGCEKPLGNLYNQSMKDILSSEYANSVNERMKSCNLPCKILKCNIIN